jgi:putative transposase
VEMPWKQIEPMNQRTEFVLKAIKTDNFRALCQEYGISAKTGYKWKERFLQRGLGGLEEESRRPRSTPTGLDESVVCEILRIKQKHLAWGPRKVRAIYSRHHSSVPSESSFKRVLEKSGYTEKRRSRLVEKAGRLATGKKAQAPNEVWTVDFKGWWYGGNGSRCEPLTIRDEYSRYLLDLRLLPDAKGPTVRKCFERLFERHGLPGAIRSDNGVPFASTTGVLGLTQLSAWWVALGIDLERGRPGCPQDNGGHERFHLDVYRELEKDGSGETQSILDEWANTFNCERPHEALGMKCPGEVYVSSLRKYEGTPEFLVYKRGIETRKVLGAGTICWQCQFIFISEALKGWTVGLEPARQPGFWDVWFGKLLLGQLETATASFQRTKPSEPKEKKE